MKAVTGRATTEEQLAERRADLLVIATAHNGAKFVAVTISLMVLLADAHALVRAMGFKADGTLTSVSSCGSSELA